jgi:hypothetical protein
VVGSNALESANGHGLWFLSIVLLDATAPTRWLARPVAGSTQDTGENIGHPIDHVGIAVATLTDQTDVLRNGGMSRTGPLAIDDLVEVRRMGNVDGLQICLLDPLMPRNWAAQVWCSLKRCALLWDQKIPLSAHHFRFI